MKTKKGKEMKTIQQIIFIMMISLASLSNAEDKEPKKVQKWEYKTISSTNMMKKISENRDSDTYEVITKMLNELGEKGWELVVSSRDGSFILKRKK